MVKNGSTKRRAKRARSTRRGGRRNVARMTSAPPLLSFNRQLMNTVLRGSMTIGISAGTLYSENFNVKSLISGYSQLVSVFTEFKVTRVRVWAYTTLSTSAPGVASMVVTPSDYIPQTATYEQITVIPGAITRRIWQPFHCVYYPTSPNEKDWFLSSEAKTLFTLMFMCKDVAAPEAATYKNELQIIWDVHIRCRGLKTANPKPPGDVDNLISTYEVMTTN